MKTSMNHPKASLNIDMKTQANKATRSKKKVRFESSRVIRGIMVATRNKSQLQILIERVHRSGLKFMETSYVLDMKRNRFHRSGHIYDSPRKVATVTAISRQSNDDTSFGYSFGGTTISLPQTHTKVDSSSPEGMTVWQPEEEGDDGNESESTLGV